MKTPNSHKNITRFTYENTAFQGWRLAICRQNKHFACYFSDRQYGGEEESLNAAIEMREEILKALSVAGAKPQKIFDRFKSKRKKRKYPTGLRAKRQAKDLVKA